MNKHNYKLIWFDREGREYVRTFPTWDLLKGWVNATRTLGAMASWKFEVL